MVKGTCVDDELKRSREFTRGLLSSTYYGTAAGEPKGEPVGSLKHRSTEKRRLEERIEDLNAKNRAQENENTEIARVVKPKR